jgi:two-component system response regulator NreC
MSYCCRVVLADDHAVVRAGIKLLIELTKRYEVVGEAGTGKEVVERVAALQPDLVVMDVRMPDMDGISATRRITKQNADVRVLVLTAYDDPEYVEAVIEAGAMGCLSKRRARSDLVAALDMLASGRMSFPAHLARLLSKTRSPARQQHDDLASLSERERDILFLTAAGYTADEIASKIFLAPKTVANYRSSLKSKLGVQSRADLMRVVAESGHLADMLKTAGINQVDG